MNAKIRKMMREIESRGGRVGVSELLPDDVAEQFLDEILDCPHCMELAEADQRIDRVLGRSRGRDH